MAKDFQMSFVIGAALASGFRGAFIQASSTLGDLQKKASAMSKTAGQVNAYQRLQEKINTNQAAMVSMRQHAGRLASQMAGMTTPSSSMQKEFNALTSKANDLEKKLDKDREALSKLRPQLVGAGVDMRNLGTEQARLAAASEKHVIAQQKLAKAQGNLKAAEDRLSWNNMKGEVIASASIAFALSIPIRQAVSFEQAMAKVGTVAGATGEDFELLKQQARELGKTTQFTATQAANSQENLARAGFKTQEIIQTMPSLLNMAAAENMDIATAADIASSVLRGYQFQASQSTRVADVLAKASAASNTSIVGIGESMKYVAPIAAGLKIPFEEAAAMIGVMGDSGIKGSEAGTALRAALLRLSKEPKQTEEALRKLGVATRDVKGNLRTMPSLMQALSQKMKNMGEADKMGELSKIFGTEAASGMLAIMKAAESGRLKELSLEMNNAGGAASKMAKRMNDTAEGAMKRLSSASESVMIDIGNVLLPVFSEGVEVAARLTGGISDLAQRFPDATRVIVGAVAALAAYKIAVTVGSIAITAAKLPYLHLQVMIEKVNAKMLLYGNTSIAVAAKTKIAAVATKIQTAAQAALNIVMGIGRAIIGGAQWAFFAAKQLAIAIGTKIWAAAQWALNAAMSANPIGLIIIGIAALITIGYQLYKNWGSVCAGLSKAWDWLWNKMRSFFDWISAGFSWSPLSTSFSTTANWISNGWDKLKSSFNWENVNAVWETFRNGADTAISFIGSGMQSVYSQIESGFTKAGSAFKTAVAWAKGDETSKVDTDRAKMAAQIQDITMINQMSEGFASKVQQMATVYQPFKQSLGEGFQTIYDTMTQVGIIIMTTVIPSVNALKASLVGVTAGMALMASVGSITPTLPATTSAVPHALGGIFSTPHVGLVAEAGREAIIPLEDRSRGMPLWLAAGDAMGVKFGGNNQGKTAQTTTFAPSISITVDGGGDDGMAQRIAQEVKRAIREMEEYRDRTCLS